MLDMRAKENTQDLSQWADVITSPKQGYRRLVKRTDVLQKFNKKNA